LRGLEIAELTEEDMPVVWHKLKRGVTMTSHPKGINPYYECGN